ncbi:MAG: double zinc ribbon domain-containing protein [Anaerovoracaceae bacterium]
MLAKLSKLIEYFLDLVFPENIYCISCNAIIDKSRPYSLCDNCVEKFHWYEGRACTKCGKLLPEGYFWGLCYDCRQRQRSFSKGYSCCSYGLYERQLIQDLKYRDKSYLGRIIADIMYDRMEMEDITVDIIVPVPVHKKRLRQRGYNQAGLIAKALAKKVETQYIADLLQRTKITVALSGLKYEEREALMRGAFKVNLQKKTRPENMNILIVDDIFTTGSTFDNCAAVLFENGAKNVYVLSFASGWNYRPINV